MSTLHQCVSLRHWRAILLLALSFVVATGCIYAQATASATLLGTVKDPSGAVVPNAKVELSSSATGLKRSGVSDGVGSFRFDLLPAVFYEVKVTVTGFSTAILHAVELTVSATRTVEVGLEPGKMTETVTVEASGMAAVDTTKTDVSMAVTKEQVEELPLNGRDFVNLAILAAGAKPVDSYDPTKNRVGVFAVNGSSGRNVNVTVNGIDNKDNTVGGPVMQLPLEAIEEFNISTQRFSAANGRSEGAAINVITKSGTNTPHGSLYFFGRNQDLNAQNYFESEKAPYSREQFGGSVGAPIKKDKTFVFFALERTREQTNISVDPASYAELQLVTGLGAKPAKAIPTPYFDWRYSGKLDHHFNDKNTLSVSYNNQNNNGQNDQSGSQNDLTEGNFTTNQLILANATLTSVLSSKAINAFTAGYQYWNNLIDSTQRVPYNSFPSGVSFGTNINVPQQSFQKKWQFKDDFSYTFGKHSIKTGFDYLFEPVLGGFFENNTTLEVDFLADPSVITSNTALYPQGFATPGLIGGMTATAGNPYFLLSAKMFGLYFQDDWKVSSRLSVNLGLRWDRDFNLNGASEQALSRTYLELKAINSPYAGLPKDDGKDFSPRVGLAYDLTGSGKHILRAGAGIYYGQIFENIPLFMIQQANATIFTNVFSISSSGATDANADIVPGTGIQLSKWRYGVDPYPTIPPPPTELPAGSTGRLMVPDYHNPYTEQFNVGYAWQLNSASVVEVEYIHSLGLRESKTIELNPKDPNNGGTRVLQSAFDAAGVPALGGISAEFSNGRSRYDGLNFSYRRRMSRHFSINTNYVLSRSLAYEGSAAAFRNRPTDPYNVFAAHDFGPTPSDETHRVVFSGLLDLPWGIKVSPMIQWASARPYNTQEGIDYYGYGRNNENAIVPVSNPNDYAMYSTATAVDIRACLAGNQCKQASFDSLRGQTFFQFDARVAKTIRIKERATLDVFFQAFDITNRANFGADYNGNVRSSNFRTPTGFITPSGVITPRSFSGEFGTTFRF